MRISPERIAMERRLDYVAIDDIKIAPNNPKGHMIDNIRASIDRFGYVAPMIVDERTGRLVVGHGRLESLRARWSAGEPAPEGVLVDADSRWLAPIVRGWSSRSDAEASAYLVLDNRQTELGGWDDRALASILDEIGDSDLIELTGWDPADLEGLIADDGSSDDPIYQEDDTESPCVQVSNYGDIWALGQHRLLCGDATNLEHIDRVLADLGTPGIVYADPPYGIMAVPKDGGKSRGRRFRSSSGDSMIIKANVYRQIANDDTTDVAAQSFALIHNLYPTSKHIWWGGNHYANSAGLPNASCWLGWGKESGGNDFADAELAWTNHHGAVRLLRHMWNGMIRASEKGGGIRVHPTQKPVALAEWAFEQVDRKREHDIILDPFGGSGSTLIAAHQTKRRAALVELEPYYVDIICRRFQRHTGITPGRVLSDGDTRSYDFMGS